MDQMGQLVHQHRVEHPARRPWRRCDSRISPGSAVHEAHRWCWLVTQRTDAGVTPPGRSGARGGRARSNRASSEAAARDGGRGPVPPASRPSRCARAPFRWLGSTTTIRPSRQYAVALLRRRLDVRISTSGSRRQRPPAAGRRAAPEVGSARRRRRLVEQALLGDPSRSIYVTTFTRLGGRTTTRVIVLAAHVSPTRLEASASSRPPRR